MNSRNILASACDLPAPSVTFGCSRAGIVGGRDVGGRGRARCGQPLLAHWKPWHWLKDGACLHQSRESRFAFKCGKSPQAHTLPLGWIQIFPWKCLLRLTWRHGPPTRRCISGECWGVCTSSQGLRCSVGLHGREAGRIFQRSQTGSSRVQLGRFHTPWTDESCSALPCGSGLQLFQKFPA